MNCADGEVFAHFTRQTRNPYPSRIVWKQCSDVAKPTFYWLSVSGEHCRKNTLVEAIKRGQSIEITSQDLTQIEINLNENFFDFEQKLKVFFNGKLVFENFVNKDENLVRETFAKRCDPFMCFCSRITVNSGGELENLDKNLPTINVSPSISHMDKTRSKRRKKFKIFCF